MLEFAYAQNVIQSSPVCLFNAPNMSPTEAITTCLTGVLPLIA